MFQWLKVAFAVEAPDEYTVTPEEAILTHRLAVAVVKRELTSPALIFLESSRPLNFIASQAMVFFAPILRGLFKADDYRTLSGFLERRGSVEYICREIERVQESREDGVWPPAPPAEASATSSQRIAEAAQ